MAWRCSGKSNVELVQNLREAKIITQDAVKKAMLQTDRANYVSTEDTPEAYEDRPLPIHYLQTISAPHMHAYALELATDVLVPGAKVLDVGCGSGYLSACFARMVGATGSVFGIEVIPDLLQQAVVNVRKQDEDLLTSKILHLEVGDGWKGLPNEAPFDYIHVGAAAARVPQALVDQLNDNGGKLIIPVGGEHDTQYLMEITKKNQRLQEKRLMAVRYVPLVEKH